ncbi:MAG: hypothetical protein A2W35_17150 [Chloroflexi bacterium RBG_16_57_11]|nr:MAG: hypothetical protein A2W35_17150 [Chloroflexi bacterium RBG_16_57_11]
MIVTTLAHMEEQLKWTPALQVAFSFLRSIDAGNLQDGRIVIDGERVFAIVSAYTTKIKESHIEMEGHRKFIDLQYLAQGEESICWAPAEQVPVTTPYQSESDAWQGELPLESVTWVRLAPGQVAVLYPSDAHAPQYVFESPAPVKKIVVKVALE